jgi:apolipoprotein N-acyltransferase
MQRVYFGLAKLYVCLSIVLSGTIAFEYIFKDGYGSSVVYMTMVALVCLGVLDAVVNDMLPERFEARRTLRWRYVIFVALAGVQLSWIYSSAIEGHFNLGMLRYSLDVLVAAGVAVLDLHARFCLANARHEPHHTAAART